MTGSDFTLSTGRQSSIYFDCKKAALYGEGLDLIADAFLREIDRLPMTPEAIGGLTMGADFIVAAVIAQAHRQGLSTVNGSIVRKEPKTHGTKNKIENEQAPGTKIVVVDDVFTSGGSTAKACDEFIAASYDIVGIMALVDREAGGIAMLTERYDTPVSAIFTMSDFTATHGSNAREAFSAAR